MPGWLRCVRRPLIGAESWSASERWRLRTGLAAQLQPEARTTMALLDRSLPNPALALARRRLLEVNRVLLKGVSERTRPKWQRLKARLETQIAGLEKATRK